ncbi:MAG TPA: glycoside hydrolase family 3 N-terminal domain-containing protein [Ktedonobacteraceae bacterium]|nr:glycoside hydrolase family 3 N-terminal domain-containing protein [Ktedonobacteraceae bacterium]
MHTCPSERKQHQQGTPGSGVQRFLFILILLCLAAVVISFLVIGQLWHSSTTPQQYPTPTLVVARSPQPSHTPVSSPTLVPTPTPTLVPTPTPPANLSQRIDAYINHLTQTQQIGQLLMLAVYTNSYTSALNQPLQQWDIANAIVYNQYNGGPLMPTTLNGWTQLVHDLQANANQALIVATDEEGGIVDRLAPYYGPTPSPQQLANTGNPQQAYAQAQLDAQRLLALGINTDFAPLADVYQGGAVDQSRMFGTAPGQVITYAGAFLDGLQQNGVVGTLKHWPGIGSAPANPDYGLPTITHSQTQLNAIDFAPFRALLTHKPGMIMVTHVMVPAYDPHEPASLSPVLIDQVLRGQLGYQGVVVTDAMDAKGLLQFMQQQGYSNPAQAIAEASVRAILAGNDIVECPIEPDRLAAVVAAVTTAVQTGRISQERLRQSLRRIIALKVQMGLISLP